MSTVPETSFDLQVPHRPLVHEDGQPHASAPGRLQHGHALGAFDDASGLGELDPVHLRRPEPPRLRSTAACSAPESSSKLKLSSWWRGHVEAGRPQHLADRGHVGRRAADEDLALQEIRRDQLEHGAGQTPLEPAPGLDSRIALADRHEAEAGASRAISSSSPRKMMSSGERALWTNTTSLGWRQVVEGPRHRHQGRDAAAARQEQVLVAGWSKQVNSPIGPDGLHRRRRAADCRAASSRPARRGTRLTVIETRVRPGRRRRDRVAAMDGLAADLELEGQELARACRRSVAARAAPNTNVLTSCVSFRTARHTRMSSAVRVPERRICDRALRRTDAGTGVQI